MGVVIGVWQGASSDTMDTARRIAARRGASGESQVIGRAHRSLGLAALSRGAMREAYQELLAAFDALEVAGILHPGVEPALPDAVEAAAVGDRVAAQELLERLEERIEPLDSAWLRAVTARARGCVLLVEGRSVVSIESLREAVEVLDGSGHAPDSARTLLVLGRTHVRAGQRTAAADAFADALGRFESMGASLWAQLCVQELERVAPGRSVGALTPTEERLAGLVAEGATNKEIASAMYLSVATVEAHLTRIYRKLDLRSRSDLTRWVQQRGRSR
jgi:DNA-binding CsgD family transcriptional regulator